MLSMEDDRWIGLAGGYRMPFDPRPLLTKLEISPCTTELWHELIGELYHQGDVGEASYAAVPYLVRIGLHEDVLPWQLLTLITYIELARTSGDNPRMPEWLERDYLEAIEELALRGMRKIGEATSAEQVQGILSVLSLWKGLRVYAAVLAKYTEDELNGLLHE